MSQTLNAAIAMVGNHIGKNSHIVGLDERGAIVLRQKWSLARSRPLCQYVPVPVRHRSLRRRASSSLNLALGHDAG